MTAPVRLQLSRKKGFDLQGLSHSTNGLTAIKVDRTTLFGNHYRVDKDPYERIWNVGDRTILASFPAKSDAIADAVARFRADVSKTGPHNHRLVGSIPTPVEIMKALRGHNLACWCEIGTRCHADVLLEIANGPLCEAA